MMNYASSAVETLLIEIQPKLCPFVNIITMHPLFLGPSPAQGLRAAWAVEEVFDKWLRVRDNPPFPKLQLCPSTCLYG